MPGIKSPAAAPTSETIRRKAESLPKLVPHRARILSVSASPMDHAALRRIIDHGLWQLATAGTCREALKQRSRSAPAVVFCEASLPDGTWKDILGHLAGMAEPPPVIVTSRLADDYLWSEVLNLGGYDVLVKPFIEYEVRQVLASAWRHRLDPVRRTRVAGMM